MKTTCRSILTAVTLATFTISIATVQAEDYTYETNSGTITITGYTGSGGDVIIPSVINALPLTSIGAAAFSCCTSIISITIPFSVTNIGFRALGSSAWGQCMSLVEINIDPLNTKYSSANGALYDKKQTTLIQYPERRSGHYVIPPTVVDIGEGAFFYCE